MENFLHSDLSCMLYFMHMALYLVEIIFYHKLLEVKILDQEE